jgi:hypothetical protein
MGKEVLQITETTEATATTVVDIKHPIGEIKHPIGGVEPEAEPQVGQVQIIVATGAPADLAVLTRGRLSLGKNQEEEEETTEEEETEESGAKCCGIRNNYLKKI